MTDTPLSAERLYLKPPKFVEAIVNAIGECSLTEALDTLDREWPNLPEVVEAAQQAESLRRERDAWTETAAQHCRNECFYHDLVTQIGGTFGDAAKTCDDGSLQDSILALKVPELVSELQQQAESLRAERDELLARLNTRTTERDNWEAEVSRLQQQLDGMVAPEERDQWKAEVSRLRAALTKVERLQGDLLCPNCNGITVEHTLRHVARLRDALQDTSELLEFLLKDEATPRGTKSWVESCLASGGAALGQAVDISHYVRPNEGEAE